MPKNKSVHCVECTKVIMIIDDERDSFDIVVKCPECGTYQHVRLKIIIKRKIIVERLDKK